jgi:hypothetical protein
MKWKKKRVRNLNREKRDEFPLIEKNWSENMEQIVTSYVIVYRPEKNGGMSVNKHTTSTSKLVASIYSTCNLFPMG